MKKLIIIIFTICLLIVIALYFLSYRDLKGVFSIDKNFRSTTKYIIVHHDDIDRECTIREIDTYHRDSCGWSCGFAYNFYVKGGKVYQVHDADARLAHTEGWNSQAVGVCIHTADKNDFKTQIVLVVTLKFLMCYYDIPKENVRGHCDFNDTKCPEMNLKKLREWL